jgi:hypothetical protein
MPAPTVIDWVNKDIDELKAAYARARDLGRYTLADEIIELADDGSKDWEKIRGKGWRFSRENLARAKLRISARRFLCVNTRPTYERGPLTIEIVRFSGEDCWLSFSVITGPPRSGVTPKSAVAGIGQL